MDFATARHIQSHTHSLTHPGGVWAITQLRNCALSCFRCGSASVSSWWFACSTAFPVAICCGLPTRIAAFMVTCLTWCCYVKWVAHADCLPQATACFPTRHGRLLPRSYLRAARARHLALPQGLSWPLRTQWVALWALRLHYFVHASNIINHTVSLYAHFVKR